MLKRPLAFVSDGGFLARASIVELAVGLMVVFALQEVISKLVAGIIMPILGALVGGFWFVNYFVGLTSTVTADTLDEAQKQGAVLAYGDFLTTLINFVIVMFAALLVLRVVRRIAGKKVSADDTQP